MRQTLENRLVKLGFLGSGDQPTAITNHLQRGQLKAAKMEGFRRLEQARQLLREAIHDQKTVEVGDYGLSDGSDASDVGVLDSGRALFGFPRCQISAGAEALTAMMFDCVSAAMDESADAARHYLHAARQMTELFCVLSPAEPRQQQALQAGGAEKRVALTAPPLFHNDCMWLAHHCLTLGFFGRRASDLRLPT